MTQTESILRSFGYTLDYLFAQVDDLDADEMVLQSEFVANHPAWVLGHLAVSCQATEESWDLRVGCQTIGARSLVTAVNQQT